MCETTGEREVKARAPLDDPGCHQSLLGVQVGRGLVDQVDVGRFAQTQCEGNSLQLTTGQVLHLQAETGDTPVVNRRLRIPAGGETTWCLTYILVNDALNLHGLHDVGDELRVGVGVSDLLVQQSSDAALYEPMANFTLDWMQKLLVDENNKDTRRRPVWPACL